MSDRDDFLRMFLTVETDLRAFVRSVLRNVAAEEDVVQDTALVLWEKFAEYDRSRPFGAWARGVAAKRLLKRREKEARSPATLAPEAVQALLEAFDRVTDQDISRRQEALEECLGRLPDKSREVIERRYRDERSPQQIADESGRSIAAVYQVLSRVRLLLEECIRERLAAWEGGGV